jgi:predicted nucleic acid-binding protein
MASTQSDQPPKVFIDSSVLLAAAVSPSGGARELLIQAFAEGKFRLSLSPLVLEETGRNLAQKSPDALPYYRVLEQFLTAAQVHPSEQLVRQVAEHIELKDAPIVAGAIAAQARFLATHDQKHLLKHKELIRARFDVTVATPGEILALRRGEF